MTHNDWIAILLVLIVILIFGGVLGIFVAISKAKFEKHLRGTQWEQSEEKDNEEHGSSESKEDS